MERMAETEHRPYLRVGGYDSVRVVEMGGRQSVVQWDGTQPFLDGC